MSSEAALQREDGGGVTDVVLVSMPFADLERPNLAVSQLKAVLADVGLATRIREGSLGLAEAVGPARYMQFMVLLKSSFFGLLLGDFVYAPLAFDGFGDDLEPLLEVVDDEFRRLGRRLLPGVRRSLRDGVSEMRSAAAVHLQALVSEIVALRPRIVGCTSTFQQHVAGLALLRRVRALEPSIATVMGGANCETRMGRATHRAFPWVDYVVSGEADGIVAPLFAGIMEGAPPPLRGVFTPAHRDEAYPFDVDRWRATFTEMDRLPTPDFSDYFSDLERSPLAPAVEAGLPLETSRGCWWGALHHCTFCGLNGGGLAYRSKSPGRVLADLDALSRWGVRSVYLVDNILDMRYFDSLLPSLPPLDIFVETKSNLRAGHVRALEAAGVSHVQPGIESLDSRVLALVDKGARGVGQVAFLKHARARSRVVLWNLLFDVPGADDAWYAEQADLFPLLAHLQPPSVVAPLLYDRYSPYFEEPQRWGLTLEVPRMMALTYPLPPDELREQCYHFERAGGADAWSRPGVQRMREAVAAWQRAFADGRSMLRMDVTVDEVRVFDSRPCALQAETVLRGVDRGVYLACDEPQPLSALRRLGLGAEADTEAALRRLVDARLMLHLDRRWLALAVEGEPPPWPTALPMGRVRLSALADLSVGRQLGQQAQPDRRHDRVEAVADPQLAVERSEV